MIQVCLIVALNQGSNIPLRLMTCLKKGMRRSQGVRNWYVLYIIYQGKYKYTVYISLQATIE